MAFTTSFFSSSNNLISRRLKIRLRRLTPLLVWVGVLILATPLYLRQVGGGSVTGFAREARYCVAPETAGRLDRIEVKLNQDVTSGQVVASLDDDEVMLQLREARTELEQLAHHLGREKAMWQLNAASQQVDQQTNLRRFARDASDAHIEYLSALADLAENRIQLQGLEIILGRTRQLEDKEMTSGAALDDARIAFDALDEKVAGQEKAVAIMVKAHQDADSRYREFLAGFLLEVPDTELLLRPLESGLKILEIRIEMANLAISKCILRAPANGRVVEIHHENGDMVAAGQPVISILNPQPTGIVAYLPENQILDLEPGAKVHLQRVADPQQIIISSVAGLGANVEQMPLRNDPLAMAPSWGLAVFVPLPDAPGVKPGEAFIISY